MLNLHAAATLPKIVNKSVEIFKNSDNASCFNNYFSSAVSNLIDNHFDTYTSASNYFNKQSTSFLSDFIHVDSVTVSKLINKLKPLSIDKDQISRLIFNLNIDFFSNIIAGLINDSMLKGFFLLYLKHVKSFQFLKRAIKNLFLITVQLQLIPY